MTVLSFSVQKDLLREREVALRKSGFKVVSVDSESQARFEVEMGRCGTLLVCYSAHPDIANELARLFRGYCPEGCIVFVVRTSAEHPGAADRVVTAPEGMEGIIRAVLSGIEPASRRAS